MRQLWVRLSLAFSTVVFVSFALVSLLSVVILRVNAERALAEERTRIVDAVSLQVQTYYATNGTLDGISSLMEGVQIASPNRMFPGGITLIRPDNTVIFGSDAALTGTRTAITYDGTLLATMVISPPPVPRDGGGIGFFPNLRDMSYESLLLMAIGVGVIVSLISGILISRWLTKPLHELAGAAYDIGRGKMDRRVKERKSTSEIQLLANAFNRMVDQLNRAEQLRRSLVADVAHELRTPITALQSSLYAILDDAYPMTKSEIAGLYEQTRTLSRLVNDLHDIAQAEASQLPMNLEPIDLAAVIEEFTASFMIVTEMKAITFTVETPPSLPRVLIDKQRIHQVLNNLLSNALRHTPEGGSITVKLETTDNTVQIAVRDSGEGISPEHLPHIFERFYRGDSGRSRDMGGTGLGLAIVKAIVGAHGGMTTATSIIGQGTTMMVRLPLYAPDSQRVVDRIVA
ncbi:MAG: ATP-binding protein [Anaerolineae bacterium]